MKYIVTKSETGVIELFTFVRAINHDDFANSLESIKTTDGNIWFREYRQPIHAGFINSANECYGHSETLGLDSRPSEDTELLKQQLQGVIQNVW